MLCCNTAEAKAERQPKSYEQLVGGGHAKETVRERESKRTRKERQAKPHSAVSKQHHHLPTAHPTAHRSANRPLLAALLAPAVCCSCLIEAICSQISWLNAQSNCPKKPQNSITAPTTFPFIGNERTLHTRKIALFFTIWIVLIITL